MRWDLDPIKFNRELREEHRNLYKQAVDRWGEDAQISMVFEECSELMVVLSHARRSLKHHTIDREGIISEIADVSLVLEQLCFILKVSPAEWFTARENKLKRLKERLTK